MKKTCMMILAFGIAALVVVPTRAGSANQQAAPQTGAAFSGGTGKVLQRKGRVGLEPSISPVRYVASACGWPVGRVRADGVEEICQSFRKVTSR